MLNNKFYLMGGASTFPNFDMGGGGTFTMIAYLRRW